MDTCQCGDYHFTIDRSEKDALLHVPNAGLTQYEQMGMAKKADRFTGRRHGTPGRRPASRPRSRPRSSIASSWHAKLFAPPPIKFTDLENFISEHKLITGPVFPFDVRTDFIKVTENTDLVPITLQIRNRDITFVTKDGVAKGVVNILGKVTTLTHKTVQTFEDTVEVDAAGRAAGEDPGPPVGLLEGSAPAARPLPPGYRHQGREQPGPHGYLRARHRGAHLSTTRSWPPPR